MCKGEGKEWDSTFGGTIYEGVLENKFNSYMYSELSYVMFITDRDCLGDTSRVDRLLKENSKSSTFIQFVAMRVDLLNT